MTSLLLFCIAEEAKPFIRKVLSYPDYAPKITHPFLLAASPTTPNTPSDFPSSIPTTSPVPPSFTTRPISACDSYLLAIQDRVSFLEQDILFIADARSATDHTLLARVYRRDQAVYGPDDVHGKKYPPVPFAWYEVRVRFEEAWKLHSLINFGPAGSVDEVLFERRVEVEDGEGVFSVGRAEGLVYGTGKGTGK